MNIPFRLLKLLLPFDVILERRKVGFDITILSDKDLFLSSATFKLERCGPLSIMSDTMDHYNVYKFDS